MSTSAGTDVGARQHAALRDAELGEVDWSAHPPGTVSALFAAPSGPLATVSLGDPSRPRVVLVPGVTGSKEDFLLMSPVLAAAGYHVQSLDLAGQYESHAAGPGPDAPYTRALFEDDLIAFLEAGSPAHLLGYSFAGTVAQGVAVRRPDLVLSLALLSTPPLPGDAFRGLRWLGAMSSFASPEVGAALMLWGIRTNKNRVPQSRLDFVRSRFALTDRRSVTDIVGLMKDTPDLREGVRALPIPKLVAAGHHDLWPPRLHRTFAEEIGADFQLYATGHSPCETTPHQLCLDLLSLYGDSTGAA